MTIKGNKGHEINDGGNQSLREAIDRRHADRQKRREENPWTPKESQPVKGSWKERNR